MQFLNTRDDDAQKVSFANAILNPNTNGLFVPDELPKLPSDFFEKTKNYNYKQFALEVFRLFDLGLDEKLLKQTIDTYDAFDTKEVCPLVKIKDDLFILELFNGQTKAFKDMALTPFGYLFSKLAKENANKDKQYLIIVATSGDTGPATLNAFKNCDGIKVVCMYPNGGTSDIQRLQMISDSDTNHKILAINGNFDDAQSALKRLLACDEFKDKLQQNNTYLSVANSVNFGRIAFQIVYHIYTYAQLLANNIIKKGDSVRVVVPSGNFGNALGAYYAKAMGVNISKIAICTNQNNVLSDFINKGIYDLRGKKLIKTNSPAMDILKSSNVERVLYELFGSKRTSQFIDEFEQNKFYQLNDNEIEKLQQTFEAFCSDDKDCAKSISQCYEQNNYIIDPHTATAFKAYEHKTNNNEINIICSTAHWGKFAPFVANALGNKECNISDAKACEFIANRADIKMPSFVKSLLKTSTQEPKIINTNQLSDEIFEFLKTNL